MEKEYICTCGRIFTNPQSFNAHKRHCIIHLEKAGKLEKIKQVNKIAAQKAALTHKTNIERKHELLLQKWISEKHTCEKCGKVMTEKFGSGRFCSRACANGRIISTSTKIKISETLRKRTLTKEEIFILLNKEKISAKRKYFYNGPELPKLVEENLNKGYFSRLRMSYAEKFWKQVLDNNKIKYEHDFIIQRPQGLRGVYRLDFLVDNIDIEIDGEMHNEEDVVRKDAERDLYLNSLGYITYRIKWVNPINDKNKEIVNNQIDELFKFLQKPRLN